MSPVEFEFTGEFQMEAENSYGVGFFLIGNYHILCRDGNEYRFHIIKPHYDLNPVEFDYYEARKFIETHPICSNFTRHEIRIMHYSEIQDILLGRSQGSSVISLALSSEEEEEKPIH
jgi:hypothetical protein